MEYAHMGLEIVEIIIPIMNAKYATSLCLSQIVL
jgi:hypothetical protein